VRVREVRGILKRFVLQPEDIEIDFVALGQLGVRERLEPLGRPSLVPVLHVIAGYEVVQVSSIERVLLEREVLVRPKVVNPQRLRPWLLARRLAIKKDDVCLNALCVKNARWQSQQRVHVRLLEQLALNVSPNL
jgi:hypothetical protein